MSISEGSSINIIKKRQPVKLLKSVNFPTYQLYAKVSNRNIDPKIALKIAVLETMSWLRKRFREIDIPDEIVFPEPIDYKMVNKKDFKSFHINEGYVLDVVYVEEYGIWSLRLTEPDLGPEPGKQKQKRDPIPGRIFQTNIAFIIQKKQLECGFKTVCLEPEGTNGYCEVFRLAVVKAIVRNELLGLKQVYPIIEGAHYIDNISKINGLKSFIKNNDRQMPLVILTEYIPKINVLEIERKFKDEVLNPRFDFSNTRIKGLGSDNTKERLNKPQLAFEVENLIKYRMGYAQFAILSKKAIEDFNRIMGIDYSVSEGDVRIIYPLKINEDSELYKLDGILANKKYFNSFLMDKLQNYPKGKIMNFGNVKFVNEARVIEQEQIINSSNSKESTLKANEIKLESIKQVYKENINSLKLELEEKNMKISKLKHKISLQGEELKNKDEEWQSKLEEQEIIHAKQIDELNDKIKRMEQLLDRPEKPEDVVEWVEKHFSHRLIFHKKAKDLITKTLASEVDMDLLCDAIEFLGCEYRDQVLGLISKDDMYHICAEKYNRPFDVGSSGDISVSMYPKEYKIKYGVGFTGKPVEVPLNMHLRVGTDNENLLRIYFLFDKEEKLVVVGSLPKHLPTISYK